jgi:exonuclease III
LLSLCYLHLPYTFRYILQYILTVHIYLGAANNTKLCLTFATQNCNSLNLTTNIKNFEIKIAAIKTLGTDVIFLCDTRIISKKGISGLKRIKDALKDSKGRKYDIISNSTGNSRGVAILIACDIDITSIAVYSDPEENYIFLRASYNNSPLLLGSIYGHNTTSRDFYRRISRVLAEHANCKTIIGGDWNTVWDRGPVGTNIDTFQMARVPNQKNSELLGNMSAELALFDPYRVLYPDKRNYTYSPFGNMRLNRSRLDFFLISANVLPDLLNCDSSFSTTTKLFDHKSVTLTLGTRILLLEKILQSC